MANIFSNFGNKVGNAFTNLGQGNSLLANQSQIANLSNQDRKKLQQQGLQKFADTMFLTSAIGSGDAQKVALAQNKIRQRQLDEEDAKRKVALQDIINNSTLIPDSMKGLAEMYPESVIKSMLSQSGTDRKYEKAGDGFFRYIDDGTKVFGDVEIRDPNFVNPTPDNPMGLNKKEIFDRSDKLSDDFRAESKNFIVARDSMKRILDAANNPSPFGDLSIIFSAMKVLDPNSVVRESEFKTVADAAPLLVRLGFSADKIEAMTAGKKLTDAQRADVVGTVIRFFDSATQSQKSLEEYYGDRATGSGLKPEDVIFDYGATVVPKIQNFQFIVSLQNLTPEQLRALDTTAYTKEQKEIYLKELKKLNQ